MLWQVLLPLVPGWERTGAPEDPGCCKALAPGGEKDDGALNNCSSRGTWGSGKLKALVGIYTLSYPIARGWIDGL